MVIAAHLAPGSTAHSITYNCILFLATAHPDHQFLILAEGNWQEHAAAVPNISFFRVQPELKNGLLFHYWFNFKLPGIIRKKNITHFISETGVISLKAKIPQYIVLTDMSFLKKISQPLRAHIPYLKRFFPKFVNKVDKVFLPEHFLYELLFQKYPTSQPKLHYIGHGLSESYKPVSWEVRNAFLDSFTGGIEYFIASCSVTTRQTILPLLKAFSLFKKRQKSSMQLVLVLKDIGIKESIKDFHLYKYRQDVKLVNFVDDNQCAALFGAAYGCIYLPAVTALDYTGLNALASGTPLISLRTDSTVGMFGEASLYTELEEKEIAEQMMLLYKDEALRKILIGKGTDLIASYSWEEAALRIWECITTSALPDKS